MRPTQHCLSGLVSGRIQASCHGLIRIKMGACSIEEGPRWTPSSRSSPKAGGSGERLVSNELTASENELYIDRDIIVLASPEIAQLPNWVIALMAAGGLAAALSTAAGLLLVISSAVSHDLIKNTLAKNVSERQELRYARISAAVAIFIAGLFGIYPPGFVAEVVAFAFGLAPRAFSPPLCWVFSRRESVKKAQLPVCWRA